jgi:CRISPR-associated protein Cmr3
MTDLILSPRDGLFLKDGREWGSSQEGRAHSLAWPMPSTLLGALVTARGRVREAAGARLEKEDWQTLAEATALGPLVALRRPVGRDPWQPAHRVWPVPADAVFLEKEGAKRQVVRLDPRKPQCPVMSRDDDPALAALWWPRLDDQAKPAPSPQWWAEPAFIEWLADAKLERDCTGDFHGISQNRRVQAHVGIDPATLAARESILFAHDIVETLDEEGLEWAIGCRAELGDEPPSHATLGGDRRLARIESAAGDLFAMPARLRDAFDKRPPGLRLIAVTPAVFTHGWRPDGFDPGEDGVCAGCLLGIDSTLILRAARVPRALHVSGWDMAAGRPKPTARLVPPGAVYHFARQDGGVFTASDAERLWLAALGSRTEQGFGRFVPGVWHPTENLA